MTPRIEQLDLYTEIDTPALLVDVDAALENAGRIVAACRASGLRWRPHIKGIKTPALLRLLEDVGAEGFTCSKLGEAEALFEAGFDDILIANQIVGPLKITRLMALLRRGAKVIVSVDDRSNVEALGRAACAAGTSVSVVIEVDIGMSRAGVEPSSAPALARLIATTPGLSFAGIAAWEGHAARLPDAVQKSNTVHAAVAKLVATAGAIRDAGVPVAIVSCSGTGTYPLATTEPGITEIQAGGGVLFDVAYQTLCAIDHRFALYVLATVTSRPTPSRIVCDAGRKSLSTDSAMPMPLGVGKVSALRLSAEHAVIELDAPSSGPLVGDRVLFVVGYGDMTVHLHDEMIAVLAAGPLDVWAVSARGRSR